MHPMFLVEMNQAGPSIPLLEVQEKPAAGLGAVTSDGGQHVSLKPADTPLSSRGHTGLGKRDKDRPSLNGSEWVSKAFDAAYRAARDMELAQEAQAALFPRRLPQLASLDYAGVCISARQVGGDYFDFLDLGHGYLGLAIADVAGKGVAAALLMANLQANLRSQCALALEDIASLLGSVNRLFLESTPHASYATLFLAEYREEGRRLRYVNCGHPAALLVHPDGTIDRLESTATVMGLQEDWDCSTAEVWLVPGDTLVIYTDGVTEARNVRGEELGEHRLVELLRMHNRLPASELLRTITDAVQRFACDGLEDDVTLVAARCEGMQELGTMQANA